MSNRICSVEDCQRAATRRGWCNMHYQRWQSNGDPLISQAELKAANPRLCSVDDCDRKHFGRGFCHKHWYAFTTRGTTDERVKQPLPPLPICVAPDCDRQAKNYSQIYCTPHLYRLNKYGDPLAGPPYRKSGSPPIYCSYQACDRVAIHTGLLTGHDPFCQVHYNKIINPEPRDACPDCGGEKMVTSEYCKICYHKHRTGPAHPRWKGGGRWLKYGWTESDYHAQAEAQSNLCDMCSLPERWTGTSALGEPCALSVDHDHGHCGKDNACDECRRGLVCSNCNHIIGFANDSVPLLGQAIAYLVKWDASGLKAKEAVALAHEILDRYES